MAREQEHTNQENRLAYSPLHQAVERSNEIALDAIRANYEQATGDAKLFFHATAHTRGVTNRAKLIARAAHMASPIEVSDSDIEAAVFGAGRHDEVQISIPTEVTVLDSQGNERQLIKRQRATGRNEAESAVKAREFAEAELLPKNLLSPKQVDEAIEGIMLTTPGFNKELSTVVQPDFVDSSFIAQSIALADLAGSGMQGAEVAVFEAATLFLEDFIEPRRRRDELPGASGMRRVVRADVLERENLYRDLFLSWLDQQVKFIRGRQQLVWGEIDSMKVSKEARAAIKALFSNNNYDDSVAAIKKLRSDLTGHTFEECMQKVDEIIANVPEGLG